MISCVRMSYAFRDLFRKEHSKSAAWVMIRNATVKQVNFDILGPGEHRGSTLSAFNFLNLYE